MKKSKQKTCYSHLFISKEFQDSEAETATEKDGS